MPSSVNERVERRRQALRAAGLRPIQIWVPDNRRPGFADECRRQALLAAQSDAADAELTDILDTALAELAEPEE
ncbi:hypothetical protein HDIA_4766 [Hartmannibacter diazotrophicus]|uniref:Antitoxin MazE n=1 Tax=Hartmannibacter diazotrophicus TaxID=1482074 RepID=A0A2C9DDC5_9HYPH|nr:antitoxin MazE family protein [Hartmannibacter diazotrophicus]SON58307.1 hypothetical protein HDIA_4766 [Hartmannibacter diazotrophicus]